MQHLETLSLADDFLSGRLPPGQEASLRAHLEACPDCRAVLRAWDPSASAPWLAARVAARLRGQGRGLPGWLAPLAAGLALLLCLSAFWHPERGWLRADHAFAYSAADPSASGSL